MNCISCLITTETSEPAANVRRTSQTKAAIGGYTSTERTLIASSAEISLAQFQIGAIFINKLQIWVLNNYILTLSDENKTWTELSWVMMLLSSLELLYSWNFWTLKHQHLFITIIVITTVFCRAAYSWIQLILNLTDSTTLAPLLHWTESMLNYMDLNNY